MTLTETAHGYSDQLWSSPEGLAWYHGRGFEDRTLRHFLFGWIATPLRAEDRQYRGKPAIPYLTTSGKVIWLRVRTGGDAKYLPIGRDYPYSAPGVSLFNAQQALPTTRSRRVVVCEGEFDAAIAWQCGYKAVGVPGVRSWQPQWTHLLQSAEVVIAFDGDEAGREAARNLSTVLTDRRIPVRTVDLSDNQDVGSVYASGGPSAVRALLGG